jgi:hypothetical protein
MAEKLFALRRTTPRFSFCADADITLRDGSWLPGQLSEISARGCYVDTIEALAVDTEIDLTICDGLNTCLVRGKVLYKHTGGGLGVNGMGVLFADMGVEQHSTIDGWLQRLAAPLAPSAAEMPRTEAQPS